ARGAARAGARGGDGAGHPGVGVGGLPGRHQGVQGEAQAGVPGAVVPAFSGRPGALLEEIAHHADRPQDRRRLVRDVHDLVVLARHHLPQRLDVLDGNEVRRGISPAVLHRLRDLLDRLRLGLRDAQQCLRSPLSRVPPLLPPPAGLAPPARRPPPPHAPPPPFLPPPPETPRPPIPLRPHLLLHGILHVGRRGDVLELDPIHLDPPLSV